MPKNRRPENDTPQYEQVAEIITPLVEACFEEPLKSELDDQVAHYVTRLFLTRTRHKVRVVDSGYDISSHAVDTGEQYKLEDFETIGQFLNEPYRTEATYESGSGFTAVTYADDLDTDIVDEFIHESVLNALNRARAEPDTHPPTLVDLARRLIPEEEQEDDWRWWDIVDGALGDHIGEAVAEAARGEAYWRWRELLESLPLEPAIQRHAETVRLQIEEEAALKRMQRIKTEMLNARAEELIPLLGNEAQQRFEKQGHGLSRAWSLVRRAIDQHGATLEEAHAIVNKLNLSNSVNAELHRRLDQIAAAQTN